jgi:hypothetical protein
MAHACIRFRLRPTEFLFQSYGFSLIWHPSFSIFVIYFSGRGGCLGKHELPRCLFLLLILFLKLNFPEAPDIELWTALSGRGRLLLWICVRKYRVSIRNSLVFLLVGVRPFLPRLFPRKPAAFSPSVHFRKRPGASVHLTFVEPIKAKPSALYVWRYNFLRIPLAIDPIQKFDEPLTIDPAGFPYTLDHPPEVFDSRQRNRFRRISKPCR